MLNFKSFMNENSMEWGDIENIHTILEDICLEILAENGLIENLDDSLIKKLSKKIKPAKKTFWADEKTKKKLWRSTKSMSL